MDVGTPVARMERSAIRGYVLRSLHASFLGTYLPRMHLYLCSFHSWYGPLASQSAMPICPWTAQAVMVIPDCSLLVTTFSRHSWPLQRTATRVTSMVSF